MPAGVRILNSYGDIQVDELYRNMHLAAKVTIPVGAAGLETFLGTFVNPICVIYTTANRGFGSVFRREFSNPSRWWFTGGNTSGQTLEVFVFDVGITSDPGFGLRVFTAAPSSQVVVNILAKPLVVVDEIVAPKNATTTRNYSSGRKYAIWPQDVSKGFLFRSVSGGVVVTADNASTTRPTKRFMVVDVTAY